MKKKLLCVLLAIILTAALTSCSIARGLLRYYVEYSEENAQETTSETVDHSRPESQANSGKNTYSDPYREMDDLDYQKISGKYQFKQCSYGYQSLEEGHEQTLYEYIDYSVYQIESKKDGSGYYPLALIQNDISVSDVQFMKVLNAYEFDHPQVFWLTNEFNFFDAGSIRYFQIYSNVSAEKCEKMQKEFYLAVKKAISALPDGMSEYEREIFLHDYIIENCSYDEKDLWQRYSPYGVFVEQKAVCEGYSEAFQLLLNCAGIESSVVVGTSDKEAHQWNVAKINGDWYYLDITWDDDDDENADELDRYNYFNVSGEFMKNNAHTLAPLYKNMTEEEIANEGGEYMKQFNLYLPDCVTMDANYYYYNAATITDLNVIEGKVLDRFISTLKNKNPYFYMRCGENIDFDSMDYNLFEDDLYYQYADAANGSGRTGGNRIINDKVRSFTLDGYDDLIIAQMEYVS